MSKNNDKLNFAKTGKIVCDIVSIAIALSFMLDLFGVITINKLIYVPICCTSFIIYTICDSIMNGKLTVKMRGGVVLEGKKAVIGVAIQTLLIGAVLYVFATKVF